MTFSTECIKPWHLQYTMHSREAFHGGCYSYIGKHMTRCITLSDPGHTQLNYNTYRRDMHFLQKFLLVLRFRWYSRTSLNERLCGLGGNCPLYSVAVFLKLVMRALLRYICKRYKTIGKHVPVELKRKYISI